MPFQLIGAQAVFFFWGDKKNDQFMLFPTSLTVGYLGHVARHTALIGINWGDTMPWVKCTSKQWEHTILKNGIVSLLKKARSVLRTERAWEWLDSRFFRLYIFFQHPFPSFSKLSSFERWITLEHVNPLRVCKYCSKDRDKCSNRC